MPLQKRDEDFFRFQRTLVAQVVAHAPGWGIPAGLVNLLVTARDTYEPLHFRARNQAVLTPAEAAEYRRVRGLYERDLGIFLITHIRNNQGVGGAIEIMKSKGGGDVEVTARFNPDQTRPTMHPDADAVECRYTTVPFGEAPPEKPEDCPGTHISKKPRFIIHCGDENIGLVFCFFYRWANLTNPANSGPWSAQAQCVLIS